jgi:hypothetical protein
MNKRAAIIELYWWDDNLSDATFSTTNATWTGLGVEPGPDGENKQPTASAMVRPRF